MFSYGFRHTVVLSSIISNPVNEEEIIVLSLNVMFTSYQGLIVLLSFFRLTSLQFPKNWQLQEKLNETSFVIPDSSS